MAPEIERKFLVTEPPGGIAGHDGVQIDQGYLAIAESVEVRVRKAGTATRLTVKSGHGDIRQEVEIDVDSQAFEALWPLTEGRRLKKTRCKLPLGNGLTAEVDFFEGELEGLILAEVEFNSEGAEHDFDPPEWLGVELTGDRRYVGQSLAADGVPKADRIDSPYRLKRRESVSDGTRRIARGRVGKALERLEGSDDPEADVHGVRKDLKKLRAVLRLLRDGLDKDFYRQQNKRFRNAGRLLSDIRDAQVKLATLDALEERYGPEMPEQPSSLWRGMLEGERRQVGEGVAGDELRARMREAREMIVEGGEDLAQWPLEGHGWRALESGLLRGYRESRRAMKRAALREEPEDVHEWRKRTKDLWYHLRLLRGAWKPVIGELAAQAHELADLLGDHHDLSVLAEDLETRQAIKEADRLAGLIERRQEELLKQALKLGSRLLAEKPKAFRRRHRAYWAVWH